MAPTSRAPKSTSPLKRPSSKTSFCRPAARCTKPTNTFAFAMHQWNTDSNPALFTIKKSKTGTNSTEVHVLSGSSEFKSFILQTGTGLHETEASFEFAVTDWNADGRPNLVAVKKSNASTTNTEVHVLSGASNYRDFILHSRTALHPTDGTFVFAVADWTRDGRPDWVAAKKRNTCTKSTEVHYHGRVRLIEGRGSGPGLDMSDMLGT